MNHPDRPPLWRTSAALLALLLVISPLPLRAGDLIFMGTPAGVAALQRGDAFHAELVDIVAFDGSIV